MTFVMKKIVFFAAMIFAVQTANAQRIVTFDEYLKNVREKNIEYLVEKYNISIAEANARAAKVMPDPELTVMYEDYQDWDLKTARGYAAELDYTLELGGKRRARMAVARSEQQMTEALVEDFFRNLRADATLCYLDALKQKQLVALALSSYQSMMDLARGDSLRYALGEIAEIDAMQSRLEATTMMTDFFQTELEYKNILSDLTVFEGGAAAIDSLSGSLPLVVRIYQLQNLIELAQNNRADLMAAIRNRELSAANLRLVKANRMIDLGLNVGFAQNREILIEDAGGETGKFKTFSAGISVPLKFSNANKGELRAAQYSEQQADMEYDMVLLQIRKEVEQCYNSYVSSFRQAELYQQNVLADAATILERKKYSYARGETSLLEVLDAQRTANEVYQTYYETLYNANAALVELCRAAGIWDVEL